MELFSVDILLSEDKFTSTFPIALKQQESLH